MSLKRILSMANWYMGGHNLTSLCLRTGSPYTFLAIAAVVVVPPDPLGSGNPNATPDLNYQ